MKILLVLIAVYLLWWLLRRTLTGRTRDRDPPAAPPAIAPKAMDVCAECGLHLPRDEALPGRGGVFCGEPHRAAFELSHPER